MSKIETIMEQLQTLTLIEAAELVKKIEEVFDVDASAAGGMMMMNSTMTLIRQLATHSSRMQMIYIIMSMERKTRTWE